MPAAAQSVPPNEIVISEFRTRGPAGASDEFVELRNRSTAAVEISGWRLQGCASGTGDASGRVTVGSDVLLAPGGSYLFANGAYSGTVAPDETYGTGFTDFTTTNFAGIRIMDAGGTVRDGVGAPTAPAARAPGSSPRPPTATTRSSASTGPPTRTTTRPTSMAPSPGTRRTAAATRPASRRSRACASATSRAASTCRPTAARSRSRCRAL